MSTITTTTNTIYASQQQQQQQHHNSSLSYGDDCGTMVRLDTVTADDNKCPIRPCGSSNNTYHHSCKDHGRGRRRRQRRNHSSANSEITTTRLTTMTTSMTMTMAMIAVFGVIITIPIRETTAFVIISPTTTKTTTTKTFNTSPMKDDDSWNALYTTGSASPSSCFSRGRIRDYRRRRPSLIFAATSEDGQGSNNKKPEPSQKNKKTQKHHKGANKNNNSNSYNNSNSNSNTANSKKSNKGGPKHKKSKSSTTLSSSSSSPSPANNKQSKTKTKKKPPLDPSKQRKREIIEQIKAKIKEEGDEKKLKHTQHQNQKPNTNQQQQQQQRPKQKQSRPKDPSNESKEKRKKVFMNPFEAGKSFRDTLSNLSTLGRGLQLPKETKDKYFLDDRLLDGDDNNNGSGSTGAFFSSSSLFQSNFNGKTANGLLQDYAAAEALAPTTYIPEVLVVGATGEIGRLVVRRLLLEGLGRFRVRVLVRDLYSQTLNLLGTGVSYCQGDLSNVESLEYALTDVDKIVYVAGAPRPDETDFQRKFKSCLEEHDLRLLDDDTPGNSKQNSNTAPPPKPNDLEWEQLASVLESRSELAEQVDCIGMKNLVSAYQNVRHTDYGTSQVAKRSLFKFSKKSGDFDLFALDDGDNDDDENDDGDDDDDENDDGYDKSYYDEDQYDDEYNYAEEYDEDKFEGDEGDEFDDDENYGLELESRNARGANVVKSQVKWLRNKFDNGVFVGRVPRADANANNPGGEASIITFRLRAREDPDNGIDMSNFAGFILRVVSDGNNYEAFVRTSLYETDGIEYVYEYSTDSKRPTAENRSQIRFKTIRLAFENFKAVQRKKSKATGDDDDVLTVPPFVGSDVRYLGFRFRSSSNIRDKSANDRTNRMRNSLERLSSRGRKNDRESDYQSFYMALSYIKVYRAQPEPEFIYLSDARIPPVIRDGMVHHQRRVLLTEDENNSFANHSQQQQRPPGSRSKNKDTGGESDDKGSSGAAGGTTLLDEKELQRKSMLERSPEETYFKYRGEEILIKSGLSYTIIRVAGFNELSTSEASTIDLVNSNSETRIVPVSRAEVAQVCVSALLDPSALNKCVYMTKKTVVGKNVLDEEDISAKFEGIPTDIIL